MGKSIEKKERIPKQTGRWMIFTAVVFDLIPIFVLVITVSGAFLLLSQAVDVADLANDVSKCSWWKATTWWGIMNCDEVVKVAAFGGTSITLGIVIGPLLYTAASFVSTFFAYLLFTVWFFFKGVNIWSFSEMKKIFTTITTLVIENIPLVDLLPGTTIMVWRQVKMTQTEDKIENKKRVENAQRALAPRRARRRQPAYA